jgi:NAD(P)-dependent dehydrogenase (short-subunit alcohol dehydrogenase family)
MGSPPDATLPPTAMTQAAIDGEVGSSPCRPPDVTEGADRRLDGKVAIVTGASRGIGRAISQGLAAHGARVGAASRTEVDGESPVVELDLDGLDRCLAVNVRRPLLLCKEALAPLIAQGAGGSLFCRTSGAAQADREGRVGYSMSKAALERMCLNWAEEVRPPTIAVNVLEPGRVDPWMNRKGDWPGTAHLPMAPPDGRMPAAVWLVGQTAETWSGQIVQRAAFGKTWGVSVGNGFC